MTHTTLDGAVLCFRVLPIMCWVNYVVFIHWYLPLYPHGHIMLGFPLLLGRSAVTRPCALGP